MGSAEKHDVAHRVPRLVAAEGGRAVRVRLLNPSDRAAVRLPHLIEPESFEPQLAHE